MHRIAWYENTAGDGDAWTAHSISTDAKGATSVFAADVDGDGDQDVLSTSYDNNKVAWYENEQRNGSTWTPREIWLGGRGASSVIAADLDRDGDQDVVSAAYLDDTIAWHENVRGDGSLWLLHRLDVQARGATAVYAVDVDSDGDLDIIAASARDNTIAWYENKSELLQGRE